MSNQLPKRHAAGHRPSRRRHQRAIVFAARSAMPDMRAYGLPLQSAHTAVGSGAAGNLLPHCERISISTSICVPYCVPGGRCWPRTDRKRALAAAGTDAQPRLDTQAAGVGGAVSARGFLLPAAAAGPTTATDCIASVRLRRAHQLDACRCRCAPFEADGV